jgi:hypothetical protein
MARSQEWVRYIKIMLIVALIRAMDFDDLLKTNELLTRFLKF